MEGEYKVLLGQATVGFVRISRRGLYYRICCRCTVSGENVFRLAVKTGDKQEILGVVVPEEDAFVLEKMVPIKRLGEGMPVFLLIPGNRKHSGTFIPISPEEPFGYIERLKDSFLVQKNGKTGVMIP